jgi:hypothetical protein
MNAVTGFHRLSILAIAALLAAGCGANTPTTVPSASPDPGTPSVAPPETSEPRPTKDPCPTPEEVLGERTISLLAGSGYDAHLNLEVTSIARLDDPTRMYRPPVTETYRRAWFLGGRESALVLDYGSLEFDRPADITSISVVVTPNGQAPIDLPARLEPSEFDEGSVVAVVAPPDMSLAGTLDVNLEWTDACFRMAGTATSDVRVSAAVSIEGCPERDRAIFDEIDATFRPPIQVGGVDMDLTAYRPIGKVRQPNYVDAVHPLASFDETAPAFTAALSEDIRVVSHNDDIALWQNHSESGEVPFFPRAAWIRYTTAGGIHGNEGRPDAAFVSTLVEHANGTFSFTAPPNPGRYAAGIDFDYDAACTFGDAGATFGVDVD